MYTTTIYICQAFFGHPQKKVKISLDNFKVICYHYMCMEEKKLLTTKEVAKMLNKTPQGIHWLVKESRLKPESIAGKYKFFSQESVDEYIRKYGK